MRTVQSFALGLLMLTQAVGSVWGATPPLFSTEVQANKHCPTDVIVWLNTATGIYYFKGMRWHGNTTNGGYICRTEADEAGYRSPVFCRYCPNTKATGSPN
jgi:hypothetical protein